MKLFKPRNLGFVGVALVLALLIIYGVNHGVLKKNADSYTPVASVVEPQFVLEGKLSFINKSDTEIRTIDIEIADNDPERSRGLMHRTKLSDQQGMLFIFDAEEDQSFWMKNTKISLDILYINAKKEIVTIYRHTQPYSESPIPSFKPAQYVVEVRGGFCDQYGVKEGDKIHFEPI